MVSLGFEGLSLGLSVLDEGGPGIPHLVHPSPTQPGGRGLALVSDLSANWGVAGNDTGHSVWAILNVSPSQAVEW